MSKVEQAIVQIQKILLEDTRGLAIPELADKPKVSRATAGLASMKLGERVRLMLELLETINYIIGEENEKK